MGISAHPTKWLNSVIWEHPLLTIFHCNYVYYTYCNVIALFLFLFCLSPQQNVAAAFLFLACKVEEQPRKLEHVVTVAYGCLHRGEPMIDASSEVDNLFYFLACSNVLAQN